MKPREIRQLRAERGWTQAELAERIGTDHVTVSRWERGVSRPRRSARKRLRELADPVPDVLIELIRRVGMDRSHLLIRRHVLLHTSTRRRRFSVDPSERMAELDRALADQEVLNASTEGIR